MRQAAARHGAMSDSQLEVLVELFEQNQSLGQRRRDDIVPTHNKAGGPEVTYDMVQKWWNNEQKQLRRSLHGGKQRKAEGGQAESTHKRQWKSP